MPHSTGALSAEQCETTPPRHGPLPPELVGKLLAGLPGWSVQEGNRALIRRYAFPGRRAAVAFAQFVTELVETGGYNAWIELRAEVAIVTLFSPRAGGVTLADFQLASMLVQNPDARRRPLSRRRVEMPDQRLTVFAPSFLDWLETADDPASAAEAEWAGDWKVCSMTEDRHLVLHGWQDPSTDAPLGVFVERSLALLCAAVLPLEARPTLFVVTRPAAEPGEYGILVRDTYGSAPATAADPVGQIKELSEHQLFALHLAGCLVRSPYSLALLLEAAGPTALRLVGESLSRRLA